MSWTHISNPKRRRPRSSRSLPLNILKIPEHFWDGEASETKILLHLFRHKTVFALFNKHKPHRGSSIRARAYQNGVLRHKDAPEIARNDELIHRNSCHMGEEAGRIGGAECILAMWQAIMKIHDEANPPRFSPNFQIYFMFAMTRIIIALS